MFGPHSASCFPFLDPSANCCLGRTQGATCDASYDCRGLLSCQAGVCQGESGCGEACMRTLQGATIDCCRPEAFYNSSCMQDSDCQGARHCTSAGLCAGDSGCTAQTSGQKVIYDRECICTHIGEFCSYAQGIPCADGCAVWSPAKDHVVCSRVELFATE